MTTSASAARGKKRALIALSLVGATAAAAVAVETKVGAISRLVSRPVIVAVLDTGIDPRIPALAARLASKPGHNFADGNGDVTDTDGHGTKVALAIAQECGESGCQLLPIKISRAGAGVTAKDLVAAIRYAIDGGAKLINISNGVTEGSRDLEKIVAEAVAKNVTIVTAAGVGVKNPFRPQPLSGIYPQSYSQTIVIGASKGPDQIDLLQNAGPELDAVVVLPPDENYGSSFAAAAVSGALAHALRNGAKADPARLRQLVRHSTAQSDQPWPSESLSEVADKLGLGPIQLARLKEGKPGAGDDDYAIRVLRGLDHDFDVEIGSEREIKAIEASWSCDTAAMKTKFSLDAKAYRRGRARVFVAPVATQAAAPAEELDVQRSALAGECPLEIKLSHVGGATRVIKVRLSARK